MCVIVAIKLPRNRNTGLPEENAKWRLAKIRDRTYIPHYKIKRYTTADIGASQLFLVDGDTDWTEGVSVHPDGSFFSMVNAALSNTSDKKDDGHKSKVPVSALGITNNGRLIRQTLKDHSIEKAVDMLVNAKFDGNTFFTDGDRLFIIENYLTPEVKDEYRKEVESKKKRFDDIVPKEKYRTIVKEIKEDFLVVRTNSGVFNKKNGYVKSDGDSYMSALKRRKYTMAAVLKYVYDPVDLINTLAKLGSEKIDKNPFFRPIRRYGLAKSKDHPDINIFSTSIIQLDPTGTVILKPLKCKIENRNINNLINAKFKTNLVVLPENDKMFESFAEYFKE